MIETKEKKIGENVFSVTQLPARRALRLKSKIIKLFGPAITQILISSQDPDPKQMVDRRLSKEGEEQEITNYEQSQIRELQKSSIVKAIQLLSSSIDEKTFEELVGELMQGVRRDGVEMMPHIVDQVFAGDLLTLYQVVWFVLEANFADFFAQGGIGSRFLNPSPPSQDTKKTYKFS